MYNINNSVYAPMYVKIRTINSQRRVSIENFDELDKKIKELYNIDTYTLFSDPEMTKKLEEIVEDQIIYLEYEAKEAKAYKPEFKCNHSPDAVCSKCASLDALERSTSLDAKVKYLSYQSYLEALKDRGSRKDEYDYEIKICDDHTQKTRCSKCMDKQITLAAQVYRMIDYVEFDNDYSVANLYQVYRDSGKQRLGLLIGNYKDHPDSPLGKKAVVSCIWEIDQENFPDGIALIVSHIPQNFIVDDFQILGVIYTDLILKDNKMYSYKKNKDFMLSTVELMFLDSMKRQSQNPEFLGIAICINDDNEVEPNAFMISEQFSALMKANVLVPTTDPKFFYTERDIVYFVKNEYDAKVSMKANPLVPTDFFIVTCEVGFKNNPIFPAQINIKRPTARNLSAYFKRDYSFDKFKSAYILFYLQKYLPKNIKFLFSAVIKNDKNLIKDVLSTDEFAKFKKLMDKYNVGSWNCSHCTFSNDTLSEACEMCESGRNT